MTLEIHTHRRDAYQAHRHTIALSAIVLALLAIPACRKPAAEEVESETAVPVKTAVATIGSIRGIVHATGVVNPAPDAELIVVAPESARIAEIPRAEG